MQASQGSRPGAINKNPPIILEEENGEIEAAVLGKNNSNLEGRELVQKEQSETTNGLEEEQNGDPEDSEIGGTAIPNLGWGFRHIARYGNAGSGGK